MMISCGTCWAHGDACALRRFSICVSPAIRARCQHPRDRPGTRQIPRDAFAQRPGRAPREPLLSVKVAVFVRRLVERPRRARRHACARAPGRAALARRSCSACVGALARPRDAEVKCALDFCRRSSFVSRVFSSVVPCGARKRRAHRDGPPLARRARARAHHGWFITAAVEQGLHRAGSSFLVLSSCRRSSSLSRVFSLVAVPCGARERRAHRDGKRARDARGANAPPGWFLTAATEQGGQSAVVASLLVCPSLPGGCRHTRLFHTIFQWRSEARAGSGRSARTPPSGQRRVFWLVSDAVFWPERSRWVLCAVPASPARSDRRFNRELVFLSTVRERGATSAGGPRVARARERRLGGRSRGIDCSGSAGGLDAVASTELGGCGRREPQGAK